MSKRTLIIIGILLLAYSLTFSTLVTIGCLRLGNAVSMLHIAEGIYPPNKYVITITDHDPTIQLAEFILYNEWGLTLFLLAIAIPAVIYLAYCFDRSNNEDIVLILAVLPVIPFCISLSVMGHLASTYFNASSIPVKTPIIKIPTLSNFFTCNLNSTNLCSIARSLLSNYKIPKICLKLYKVKNDLVIYYINRSCVTSYIKHILENKLYSHINKQCIEVASTWSQYVTCIRNIETYGYAPQCRQFLTTDQYFKCIQVLDN